MGCEQARYRTRRSVKRENELLTFYALYCPSRPCRSCASSQCCERQCCDRRHRDCRHSPIFLCGLRWLTFLHPLTARKLREQRCARPSACWQVHVRLAKTCRPLSLLRRSAHRVVPESAGSWIPVSFG